ncbi:MAG: indolepyruvate oxidoreductase subunit beta [Chloroflexi bacterium]|nr:indolepyruvate oxidoreductase subunit beta [Chloroflexota bacterium]
MKADFVIAGVGGQGIVLASDLLADVGLAMGMDVKKSDVFGMSQRGGSVVSFLRIGEKVRSPLPRVGCVDYLLATEKLEAARFAGYLRPGAVAILNDHRILPLSVSAGADRYPSDDEVMGLLRARTDRVFLVPGTALATELKNPRVLNVLLLGVLSSFLPVEPEVFVEALVKRVPARFKELNIMAFERGRAEAGGALDRLVLLRRTSRSQTK